VSLLSCAGAAQAQARYVPRPRPVEPYRYREPAREPYRPGYPYHPTTTPGPTTGGSSKDGGFDACFVAFLILVGIGITMAIFSERK
jgi:hypothetical protein